MDNSLVKLRSKMVSKKNSLVRAKSQLSKQSQKILAIIVAYINKDNAKLGESLTVTITRDEMYGLLKYSKSQTNSQAYSDIKKAEDELSRNFRVTGKELGERGYKSVSWVSNFIYNDINKTYSYELHPDVLEFLIKLQKGLFTTYKLKYVLDLEYKYSLRMYELLKSFKGLQSNYEKTYDIKTLKEVLGIPVGNYTTTASFNQKVLKKIQEDLVKHSDLTFRYQYVKSNKKVVGYVLLPQTVTSEIEAD